MKHTPPKLPPMPLSPKHQRSVEKSKTINQKVESFVNSNFKGSPVSSDGKMAASSASLSNTKAFFESEIKLVMRMVEQSNKLYKQKENENGELQKKVKEYESKIAQLEQAAIENTTSKARNQIAKMEEEDESKTRKKPMNEEKGSSKGLNRTTSEFTLDRANDLIEKRWKRKYELLGEMLREQIARLKEKANNLEEQLKKQKQTNLEITQQRTKITTALAKATFDHNKIQKEHQNLTSQHKLLEQRYDELQNKHGQTVAEYQIKLTNLKSMITGINQKFWPKKQSENKAEGYYSINKPLNRNQSQQSLESFSSSKYLTPSHAEINLKEENEYLRTELIRVLDEKGALQMKVNKYKKMAIKYESLTKASSQEQKDSSVCSNENSRFLANLDKAKEIEQFGKSFKKKRQTSVLLVEGTQKKQKKILEQKRIESLLAEIKSHFHPFRLFESEAKNSSNSQQIQFLERVLKKLQLNLEQINKQRQQLNKLYDHNSILMIQKRKLLDKSQKDAASLKKYLKESTINLATPKSQDSTDKAFKHINLMEIEQDQHENQQSHDSEEFSKSMLSHYSQSVAAQQNEVRLLKEKIATLEQTIKNLENSKQKNFPMVKSYEQVNENRIVPYSPRHLQKNENESKDTECCRFDMFKQKLGEFYENTMKQLDSWEEKALKALNNLNSVKELPSIEKEQNQKPSQHQIPIIVQKNIMKISQEFESIKNSSFDRSTVFKNQEYANMLFGSQKLSKSFIKNQSEGPVETFEDIINKKLEDFNQFSSNWIEKLNAKDDDKKQKCQQNIKIKDLSLKQGSESNEIPKLALTNGAKTDQQAVDNQSYFKLELEEIDAVSDWMPDEEMRAQRKLFIREEVSYYVQKSDVSRFRSMEMSSPSKRSFKSFEL